MSTVRLKEDRLGIKKGTTVSVPFLTAQQLVKEGKAEYPTAALGKSEALPVSAAEHQKFLGRVRELEAELSDRDREIAALKEQVRVAQDAEKSAKTALAAATAPKK